MGETELTHLVGGGVLVILVLDRVANLVKLVLNKRNGAGPEALTQAIAAGFAAQSEDNKAIRLHLHSIANTLGGLVTGVAVIQDRTHRGEGP